MEIFALIGPSGTGKSHRASWVAMEHGVDSIIDDGLLIHQGRIIAGRSAKREATRMAAVKRAILLDAEDAEAVRRGLRELGTKRVLILGTSANMVHRILEALELPADTVEWIGIEQVATPEERATARSIRLRQGKHVIPAPTLEVEKSFAGYLVDPLRFILRRKGRRVLVEKSIVRPTYSDLGRFYITESVVTGMVRQTAVTVDGVVRAERVMVQSTVNGLHIELEVCLGVARNIFGVLGETQRRVQSQIEELTSLNVARVAVRARRWQPEKESDNGPTGAGG